MDPVVKQQWKNLGIYVGVKVALIFGVRYALGKYAQKQLEEKPWLSSQELQAP